MGLFNGGDQTELSSDFREAFFFGSLRETGVHIGPFVVFAFGCSLEIGCRVADAAQEIKPQTGMFLFVASGRQEDFRELFVAFATSDFSKVRVLVAGLGFTGKCGGKVFCRLSALQAVVATRSRSFLDFFKNFNTLVAKRANEISGQLIAFIDVAANLATELLHGSISCVIRVI